MCNNAYIFIQLVSYSLNAWLITCHHLKPINLIPNLLGRKKNIDAKYTLEWTIVGVCLPKETSSVWVGTILTLFYWLFFLLTLFLLTHFKHVQHWHRKIWTRKWPVWNAQCSSNVLFLSKCSFLIEWNAMNTVRYHEYIT